MLRRTFTASLGATLLLPGRLRALPYHPKLIVLLIAEQFRTDYLEPHSGNFVAGGFRRLMDDGTFLPDCELASSTFTGCGLATLATGCYPSLHGIVAERWFDTAAHRPAMAAVDRLQASTLGDQLRAMDPRNRVFGLGIHAGHAGLVCGANPTAVFAANGRAEYQPVGGGAVPDWMRSFQQSDSADAQKGAKWSAIGATQESAPMRVLAFDPAKPAEFYALFQSSPAGQAQQLNLARELINQEKLGRGAGIDYLAIVLGSLGSLGNEVGANSPLVQQLVLHLDRQVESLIELLNLRVGPGNYTLVFTGAHGAPPEPASDKRAKLSVPGREIAHAVNQALSARYDAASSPRTYVEAYIYPFLYLREESLRLANTNVREARNLAGRAALATGKVGAYYTLDGDCSHKGDWEQRFRNSFHPTRSGDVMFSYLPDYIEDFAGGRGVSYGSVYNYDARVPLIFYGSQIARGQIVDRVVEMTDVAPTLARLTGSPLPSSSTGQLLGEVFAAAPKERR